MLYYNPSRGAAHKRLRAAKYFKFKSKQYFVGFEITSINYVPNIVANFLKRTAYCIFFLLKISTFNKISIYCTSFLLINFSIIYF